MQKLQEGNWYSDLWPTLRDDNINNKKLDQKLCKACIDEEVVGKQSRRLGEIIKRGSDFQPTRLGPKHLHIALDFTCNQACMICGPACSSLWKKFADDKISNAAPLSAKKNDIMQLFENLDLQDLDTINFLGGEPLLTDAHLNVIKLIQDRGCDLSKIDLWYTTNGSCRVRDDVFEIWKKFKCIFLYFSIDDTDIAFEYQRYPGKWSILNENMNWYRERVSANTFIRVERTVSILNAHRLSKLNEWKSQNMKKTKFGREITMNNHMCHGTPLRIENISEKHLNFLKEDRNNYHLLSKIYPIQTLQTNTSNNGKVIEFVKNQDHKRNLSIQDYFPEFFSLYQ